MVNQCSQFGSSRNCRLIIEQRITLKYMERLSAPDSAWLTDTASSTSALAMNFTLLVALGLWFHLSSLAAHNVALKGEKAPNLAPDGAAAPQARAGCASSAARWLWTALRAVMWHAAAAIAHKAGELRE